MEFTAAKKDLLKMVTRMQGVAERKSTMPILSNILLVAEGPSTLRLQATDLYLAIAGKVTADVKKPGSVAVPAKELLERIKMMPEGAIHVTAADGAQTVLKSSASARRYTLRGMPGDEFPPLPSPAEGAPSLSLEVRVLQELIARTHFSVSSDETRPHINSALFEWEGDIVRMVSTDGHRLSKMDVKVAGRQATATMLIPLKAIQELRRLAEELAAESPKDAKEPPTIEITQSGPNAFFQAGGMVFSVKLVDAQFPPYLQVIPQNADKKIRIPRAAFADALRAVSIAASERTGGVKLGIGNSTMRITSESPESGDGFDEVPVDYKGPNLTIGFNAKYFLDVLAALPDEEVCLLLSGELDPAVIRPGNEQDFLGVVMPMKI